MSLAFDGRAGQPFVGSQAPARIFHPEEAGFRLLAFLDSHRAGNWPLADADGPFRQVLCTASIAATAAVTLR